MKFLQYSSIWLALLLALTLPACGERWSPPELDRVLKASWQSYRQQFISPEGRVVISDQGGGTISEAQAYALLRAVWARDEATFGRVYTWTCRHLSRPDERQHRVLAGLGDGLDLVLCRQRRRGREQRAYKHSHRHHPHSHGGLAVCTQDDFPEPLPIIPIATFDGSTKQKKPPRGDGGAVNCQSPAGHWIAAWRW